MKVAFNGLGVGYGSVGGSQTLFRMGIELAERGHSVEFWSHCGNAFDWFKLPDTVEHLNFGKDKPNYDVDILIDINTKAMKVMQDYTGFQKRFVWIRAIETWADTEKNIANVLRNGNSEILVNSIWMKKRLQRKHGLSSDVQYAGIPFEQFTRDGKKSKRITIGALHSTKKRKRWADAKFLLERVDGKFNGELNVVVLTNDGIDIDRKNWKVYKKPNAELKKKIYNECDIWLATTDNEGLHIPPMEAGLCGAALVAHGVDSAGMMDYAFHKESAMVYKKDNLEEAYQYLLKLIENEDLRNKLSTRLAEIVGSKIGSVEENAKRFERRF